jgi:hypothetical protein
VFFSGEFEMHGDIDGKAYYIANRASLIGMSLTLSPASLEAQPSSVRAGDLRSSVDRFRWPGNWRWSDPLSRVRSTTSA